MIKIQGNPLKIILGEHSCDPYEVDPLMHLCLSFASCIAKWLRRYYTSRGITESLYDVSINLLFDDKESIEIIFNTSYENYDNAVKMVDAVSDECYISKIINIQKVYKAKCDMYTYTKCV